MHFHQSWERRRRESLFQPSHVFLAGLRLDGTLFSWHDMLHVLTNLKLQPTKLDLLQLHINKWSGWRQNIALVPSWQLNHPTVHCGGGPEHAYSCFTKSCLLSLRFTTENDWTSLCCPHFSFNSQYFRYPEKHISLITFLANCTAQALLTHLMHTRWKSLW